MHSTGNLGVANRPLGTVFFLISEAMFFTGLAGAYIVLRHSSAAWPHPSEVLNLPAAEIGALFLWISCTAFAKGVSAAKQGRSAAGWFAASAAASLIFLAGLAHEFYTLAIVRGMTPSSNLFAASFFTLTGFHALHLLIGLICLPFFAAGNKAAALEVLGLYWYFVAALGTALFVLLYF